MCNTQVVYNLKHIIIQESQYSVKHGSHRNLYNNIKKNSDDFQYSISSLLNIMKKTNSSIQIAIESIDAVRSCLH